MAWLRPMAAAEPIYWAAEAEAGASRFLPAPTFSTVRLIVLAAGAQITAAQEQYFYHRRALRPGKTWFWTMAATLDRPHSYNRPAPPLWLSRMAHGERWQPVQRLKTFS